jgi:poly-beta-1,6-N-acetyl-D-glucosamine synthase
MWKQGFKKIVLFLLGARRKDNPKIIENFRPTVTVLIPAYNEELTIGSTIDSIKKQTYPIKKILVVDDCSTDQTGVLARVQLSFKADNNLHWTQIIANATQVDVVTTKKNTGAKSEAQNYGLNYVSTDVVVMVDADTLLDPKAIEYLIPALADGKTLSACGFVIPQETRTFWERARLIEYLNGLGLFKNAQENMETILVSSGCFSAFNVKLLNKIGRLPVGNIAEDMALTWRALIEGYKIKYISEAMCYPKDPENWKQFKGQVLRWYRGFFQCVSMIKGDFFKNKRLAFFITLYLIIGSLSLFLWITFLFFLATGLLFGSNSFGIFYILFFFSELIISFMAVVISGIKCHCLKKALINYPCLIIVSPINSCLFLYSLYLEWIVGKKLNYWEKGH